MKMVEQKQSDLKKRDSREAKTGQRALVQLYCSWNGDFYALYLSRRMAPQMGLWIENKKKMDFTDTFLISFSAFSHLKVQYPCLHKEPKRECIYNTLWDYPPT